MTTDKLPEWVMVPREPTEAMIRAAADCQDVDPEDSYESELYYAYQAMLAAAPPREVVVDEAIERLADDDHSVEFYRATNHGGDKLWLVAIRNSDTDNADEYEGDTLQKALAAALTPPQGEES